TFWNRRTIYASTPLRKQTSVIWREWLRSDRRQYHVPCLHCGHEQVLRWANVRWDRTTEGADQPDTAGYTCEECGALWDNVERWAALSRGQWVAEAPGAPVVGFHVSGLMSPWLTLEMIVREFLRAQDDPYLLQTWTNVMMGEPWEEAKETV